MKARKEYFTLYRTPSDSIKLPFQPNTYYLRLLQTSQSVQDVPTIIQLKHLVV